jgi:hypothetical protein
MSLVLLNIQLDRKIVARPDCCHNKNGDAADSDFLLSQRRTDGGHDLAGIQNHPFSKQFPLEVAAPAQLQDFSK